MRKVLEYTHTELDEDVKTISGYYIPEKEERLEYNKKEVLYVVGQGMIDSSCCGVGGCRYALIPGYIVNWKKKRNEEGFPVSEVEPISDKKEQEEIRKII
ncbi:MAG: hypothetical protein ACXQS7_03355, partial [Candidatus Syntropharchaeia archaeon]